MSFDSVALELAIALALFAGLLSAAGLGSWMGRRQHCSSEGADHLGTIQGAILGLLALLLGFSFSSASDRYGARTQLIVDEANAIGTVWLRTDLIPGAGREATRDLLRRYVVQRLAYYDASDPSARASSAAEMGSLQKQLWTTAVGASKDSPQFANILLPAMNELLDAEARRSNASGRHLPTLVVCLLITCALVAVAAVSYAMGVSGRQARVLTSTLAFLLASVLWTIIDLDHPRRGLIRTGQQPLLQLQHSIEQEATPLPAALKKP